MRKTKIVCTIGPACDTEEKIYELVKAGMNVARMNMSHGSTESHKATMKNIEKVRAKLSSPIALMVDTKGPEIRIGKFLKGEINLKQNATFTLTSRDIMGNEREVGLMYKQLVGEVNIGDKIFANNGLVVLKVKAITETDIVTKVLYGGKLTNNKGLNIPGLVPKTEYLSEKDKSDLRLAISAKAEFVAASFVSNRQNVLDLREFLNKNGGREIKIISKIENRDGVKNIDEILEVSDGVMVARGDLGVETPLEKIPAVQKKIINLANQKGKIVIVATEMLESMTTSVRPTRAEVSDVANAIYEKATATMLSGETAVGKHPAIVVKTMAKILLETEKHINYNLDFLKSEHKSISTTHSLCQTTCTNALNTKAKLIVAYTTSGSTANIVSSYRISTPILALTPNERVYSSLALCWNTTPLLTEMIESEADMMLLAEKVAKDYVKSGDKVIVIAGTPEKPGQTNTLKVIDIK